MTHIITLKTERKTRRQARAHGITLCRSGFHRWKAQTAHRFDVKHGRLITAERCTRCQQERTRLT